MKHNIYRRPITFTKKRSKPLGRVIIGTSKTAYRTLTNILLTSLSAFSFVFGDRETVLISPAQAGPVPEFCLNHTRIGQRWGATRARMIVVRQGGGRFTFLGRLPYHFVKLLLWISTWPGSNRYRVTQQNELGIFWNV